MDEMNTPRGSGADNLPPDWTQPLYFGGGPQAPDDAAGGAAGFGSSGGGGYRAGGPGGAGRWRRAGRGARWTAAVAAAAALAGASMLGVSLASGGSSSAGTSPAASTALTTNAAVQVAAASAGGAGHPASFRAIGSGRRVAARACIRSAVRLRRAGRIAAARARFRACLRQYPRLRFLVKLRAIVRHSEHGQVTFATRKGTRTLVFERGIIQSASAGSVVVKAADGTTWTWDLTSSTVITSGGQRATASALKAGRPAVLVGLVNSGANDARRIFVKS